MNDLIVDGNSLYARCWYAAKGIPQEALRLSSLVTLNLLDRGLNDPLGAHISRTLFAWDGKSKTEKKRQPKPPGYVSTRYKFQEALLTFFDTVHGYHPDYEADDVVATAVFNSRADQIYVVSGDKDLMQLQGGNVSYYDLNSKVLMHPRAICRKFGIKHPSQVPLALAIIGDTSDNISGVPKWGPKRAAKVFEWVTDKMNFSEAMSVVQREIPEELRKYFLESLDKTLLFTDVENVPEPAPLAFCSSAELQQLKIPGISQTYEKIAMQYSDRKSALSSMIRGSRSE